MTGILVKTQQTTTTILPLRSTSSTTILLLRLISSTTILALGLTSSHPFNQTSCQFFPTRPDFVSVSCQTHFKSGPRTTDRPTRIGPCLVTPRLTHRHSRGYRNAGSSSWTCPIDSRSITHSHNSRSFVLHQRFLTFKIYRFPENWSCPSL